MLTVQSLAVAAVVGLMLATEGGLAGRFNCTVQAPPPFPTTVDKLHPAHVSVMMAMGDSITAAFAVR